MMAADGKQIRDAIGRAPTDRQSLAIEHAREASRLTRALLAAAGEAAPDSAWYVARVAAKADNAVDNALREAGVTSWIPVVSVVPAWRGGQKKGQRQAVDRPVWPGYVFVRTPMEPRAWAAIYRVDGVVALLGVNGRPFVVSDEKVSNLKAYLSSDKEVADKAANVLKAGDRVIVCSGPFASFTGTALADESKGRAWIEVYVFCRSTPADIELAQIRKLD